MTNEVTVEQLFSAILDSQNRGNNLLGAMYNQMREDSKQRTINEGKIAKWKVTNPELSKRCGNTSQIISIIMESYLTQMMDYLDDIEDLENEFEIQEFLDKFGQGFLQLNGILQTLGHLSS